MVYTSILCLLIFYSISLLCYGNSNHGNPDHILIHGVKQYTIVLDQTSSQQNAGHKCSSDGSTLAKITDVITLRLINERLYKLRDKVNTREHELWVWGKTKFSTQILKLNENQPLENDSNCLVLSNRYSRTVPVTEKYEMYGKDCTRNLNFICEKYRDFVSSTSTFGIIQQFDSRIKWFSDHDQTSILTAVTVYEYDDGTYSYISCVTFTYGTHTVPCRGDRSKGYSEKVYKLQLTQDEFITEVTGEQLYFLRQIKFKTNKNNILGPIGKGIKLNTFKAYKYGAPLLFVSGAAGMWIYHIQFHFFSYNKSNLPFHEQLKHLSAHVANEVHDEIKAANLEHLVHINDKYKIMLPDVASRGCNIFTYRKDKKYKPSCSLNYLLEQLKIYSTSTNALKYHQTRNLKMISDYNSQVLLNEVKETKQFHKLLSGITFQIQTVGSTIEGTVIRVANESALKLANYFRNVKNFDKRIAQNDVGLLSKRILKLEEKSNETMRKVNRDMKIMLGLAVGITGAEEFVRRAQTAVATFCVIFFQSSVSDVMNSAIEWINALRDAAHAVRLLASLKTYAKYMKVLSDKFAKNENLIEEMRDVVRKLKTADANATRKLADEFIKRNDAYIPNISGHEIVYAAELLKAVVNEGCNLIDGATGVLPDIINILKEIGFGIHEGIVKEPKSVCTNLQPSIAQLAAMYGSVYNFQFELIDALTRIVRSNIAEKMADDIDQFKTTKSISVQTAAIGSMMVEIRCQAVAHARCQELEYKNGGWRPDICKHMHFTDSLMSEIISYTYKGPASKDDKFAFIPMNPVSTDSSSPYLDIKELFQHNKTYFNVPVNNVEWMIKYKWLPEHFHHSEYNKETSFFITKFEVYIPGLKCKDRSDSYQITTKVESGKNVRLFTEDASPTYIIPTKVFTFKYRKTEQCNLNKVMYTVRENNNSLSQKNSDMVCVVSPGSLVTTPDSLLPTLFSTWKITLLAHNCNPTIDSTLDFEPLISVKLGVKEIVPGSGDRCPDNNNCINECWPDTRCDVGQRCIDETLSYSCVND